MSNVVIASNDPLCQSAKNWFIKHKGYVGGPRIDVLKGGETLVIIAHDHEFKDGTPFIDYISREDVPMVLFDIKLIVCSAASRAWGKDLLSPAERIANHFTRTVYASKKIVFGIWDDVLGTAIFQGVWLAITPSTDIISLMKNLKIAD